VTILEGRDDIGGRILTMRDGMRCGQSAEGIIL